MLPEIKNQGRRTDTVRSLAISGVDGSEITFYVGRQPIDRLCILYKLYLDYISYCEQTKLKC